MQLAHNLLSERLEALRSRLLTMLDAAEKAVSNCVCAYVRRDEGLAWDVAAHDFAINDLEVEIDELSLRLLAREGPVAQDLRTIIATMRIANDVERIADEAANVAERALPLVSLPVLPFGDRFVPFAENVLAQVRTACAAVRDMDPDAAQRLRDMDEAVDCGLYELSTAVVAFMKEEPDSMERALSFLIMARRLERIADLATNIGESVFFAVRGVNAKHASVEDADEVAPAADDRGGQHCLRPWS